MIKEKEYLKDRALSEIENRTKVDNRKKEIAKEFYNSYSNKITKGIEKEIVNTLADKEECCFISLNDFNCLADFEYEFIENINNEYKINYFDIEFYLLEILIEEIKIKYRVSYLLRNKEYYGSGFYIFLLNSRYRYFRVMAHLYLNYVFDFIYDWMNCR